MAFEFAVQFLNKALGVVRESPIPKKLSHGLWLGVDGVDVVGQRCICCKQVMPAWIGSPPKLAIRMV